MKRITVTVTDWQAASLRELSELDEAPVSYLVRQALNAILPTQLELARFMRNPSTRPGDAVAIAEGMEAMLDRFRGGGGVVPDGDGASPQAVNNLPEWRPGPPSGNTGVNQP